MFVCMYDHLYRIAEREARKIEEEPLAFDESDEKEDGTIASSPAAANASTNAAKGGSQGTWVDTSVAGSSTPVTAIARGAVPRDAPVLTVAKSMAKYQI
jgi:hypothetical protein